MCASVCGLVYAIAVPWKAGRGWQINRTRITGDCESYPVGLLRTELRSSISNLSVPLFLYHLKLASPIKKKKEVVEIVYPKFDNEPVYFIIL